MISQILWHGGKLKNIENVILIDFWHMLHKKSSYKNRYGCATGKQVIASESDLSPPQRGNLAPLHHLLKKGNNNTAWELQGNP